MSKSGSGGSSSTEKIVYTIASYRPFCSALAYYIRSFYLSICPLAINIIIPRLLHFFRFTPNDKPQHCAFANKPFYTIVCIIDSHRCNQILLNRARFIFTAVMNETTPSQNYKTQSTQSQIQDMNKFSIRSALAGCKNSSTYLLKYRVTKKQKPIPILIEWRT